MSKDKSFFKKIFKVTGVITAIVLVLLFILPIVFSKSITKKVMDFANESLESELSYKDSELSFFKHFPSLTLTLNEFNLNGSQPFKNESLVNAGEISLGINIFSSMFGNGIKIDKIHIEDAKINVLVNRFGEANYNVYKSNSETNDTTNNDSKIRLSQIVIKNTSLLYQDKSAKIEINAKGFNYKGTGDLDNANFDLKSSAQIDSFSFTYDNNEYLKEKKLKANLITKINTNSLSFVFEKNDLVVNKLPIEFSGFFDFLSNGYKMDFKVKTTNSNLDDLFTALPPEFGKWVTETKTKGKTDASFSLAGDYIASENKNPAADFSIKVRNGYVKHDKAPYPIENIYLNLETQLPNLDISQLKIKLDSLYFDVNKNRLSAILNSTGFGNIMKIQTKVKSNLDLAFISSALQIPDFSLSGKLLANINANGNYDTQKRLFPVANGTFSLTNGSIRTPYYSNPIQNIQLNANLQNLSGHFKDIVFSIPKAAFTFENEPFALNADFSNFDDIAYNIKAKGVLNVGKIYQVFKIEDIDVEGKIAADIHLKGTQSDASNGNYTKLDNSGVLSIQKITTRTSLLPQPFFIENGIFTFNQDNLNFENFIGKYGSSDIILNGHFKNAINFALTKNQNLYGKFRLQSDSLNINEFFHTKEIQVIKEENKEIETVVNQVLEIPQNLDLGFDLLAKKVIYDDIEIKDISGNITLQNGRISLKNGKLNIIDSRAVMNGFYENEGTQKAHFDFVMKAEEFDIKRAYNEIKLFRELASSAENAEGIIGIDYKIKGVLGNNMKPIMPSLEGNGSISVKQVKMNNFKLMNVIAEKTENSDLKNPDLSKIMINSTIKNNIINIERFRAKVSAFRLRFEGQTSLDGELNLKMRVGLPPLGIIGIPIKVSGTHDEPKIQLGKKSEDLEETVYEEENTSNTPESLKINIPTPENTIKADSLNLTKP